MLGSAAGCRSRRADSDCGTGAGYHVFAGREVARALAIMSLRLEDCHGDLTDLSDERLAVLADWERKFRDKGYPVVGRLQESSRDAIAAEQTV